MINKALPHRTLEMVWGNEVRVRAIDWLWEPWLARGVVVVIDGDPGVGKSCLTMDLVARVTTAAPFPSSASPKSEPASLPTEIGKPNAVVEPQCALVVALEDPIDKIVLPRLRSAGADVSKVAFLGCVKEGGPDEASLGQLQLPRDLRLIEAKCAEHRPAILVIDPLFAVLGYDEEGRYIKASDDQSVRRLTARLKRLAEEFNITIVLVRHLNKASGGTAIKRGSGSIAIGGQARAVMLVGRDPEDRAIRVLAMVKNNFAPTPASLLYQVVPHGDSIRVCWLGGSDLLADELIQSHGDRADREGALECAVYFLRHTLADGKTSWSDLRRLAAEERISERTLIRARAKLKLIKTPIGEHKYLWSLPQVERLKLAMDR